MCYRRMEVWKNGRMAAFMMEEWNGLFGFRSFVLYTFDEAKKRKFDSQTSLVYGSTTI